VIRPATVCCKGLAAALLALAALGVAGGCGGSEEATPKEVVLVTHDSFAVSKPVKAAFEKESGLTLRVLQAGDAGEALNRALLTAGDPQGDVFFGVDDSYLSRAIDGDVFDAYRSPELDAVDTANAPPADEVTPIDHGEECVNVDRGWFAQRGLAPPRTLEELTLERYRHLLVVENPATSSPGLAFLLATVARYGDKWQGYWRKLKANGVKVVDGWEAAYTQQFSGAADSPGKRPIVVSYATSPAAEVIFSGKPLTQSPTAAIADGCYRQVEYAAILRGARNVGGAKKLIDFMLSERFQSDVPGSMFVYPVRDGVPLPDAFEKFAIQPSGALQLTSDQIEAGRDTWIEQWTQTVLR
jgi:thiamine transport system substrate-binding protein